MKPGDETWPALKKMAESEELVDLVSLSQLMRGPAGVDGSPARESPPEEPDDLEDTSAVPRILRMPDGVRVEERRVGRAVAQWVLQVRCECGRRWFEVDAVDTVTCPRCGVKVYVDIDARSARRREIGCEP
jgi:DNA-directed RNA polymerase subunit RPC12/RpoP